MSKERLVNQHILEYEARLKHIEELIQRAHDAAGVDDKSTVDKFVKQKQELASQIDEFKTLDVEHWREDSIGQSGPMAVWDIIAQQIEEFVEHQESNQ
ncbi:MAG: hypothetical protein HKN50_04405 [Gammaproteobacteria bacterium]|nr:hypothetical protein [Gammaproteobacteria bacterium]